MDVQLHPRRARGPAQAATERSGGTQGGRGMALAGVILSWAWLAVVIIVVTSQSGS